MTLVASGPLSVGTAAGSGVNRSIQQELGITPGTLADLNVSTYRTLAGVPSGQMALSAFYGKANSTTFSMTAANYGGGFVFGYSRGVAGSVTPSPVTLKTPGTLLELADVPTSVQSYCKIDGFSSDPGSAFISSVVSNSVTKTAASATYGYSGGVATWTWGNTFGFAAGNTYNPTKINY